jgi:hypothetical protein
LIIATIYILPTSYLLNKQDVNLQET